MKRYVVASAALCATLLPASLAAADCGDPGCNYQYPGDALVSPNYYTTQPNLPMPSDAQIAAYNQSPEAQAAQQQALKPEPLCSHTPARPTLTGSGFIVVGSAFNTCLNAPGGTVISQQVIVCTQAKLWGKWYSVRPCRRGYRSGPGHLVASNPVPCVVAVGVSNRTWYRSLSMGIAILANKDGQSWEQRSGALAEKALIKCGGSFIPVFPKDLPDFDAPIPPEFPQGIGRTQ